MGEQYGAARERSELERDLAFGGARLFEREWSRSTDPGGWDRWRAPPRSPHRRSAWPAHGELRQDRLFPVPQGLLWCVRTWPPGGRC
jgi:hypothetical protein